MPPVAATTYLRAKPRLDVDPARIERIAGVDEVGRGCLAGPVVAAAVILPRGCRLPGLDDSKKLTPEQRGPLAQGIRCRSLTWALGVVWPRDIERLNILHASLEAMRRAVLLLRVAPQLLMVDGNKAMTSSIPQETVVDGDARVREIAAASVVAKVWRDHLMGVLDRRYPGYGFALHKGYATREHRRALARLGPCTLHRRTFSGVANRPGPEAKESLWLPGL